jgi:hypothetical protein
LIVRETPQLTPKAEVIRELAGNFPKSDMLITAAVKFSSQPGSVQCSKEQLMGNE